LEGAVVWSTPFRSSFGQGQDLAGGVITCGAHLWQFDARTGKGMNPKTACLKRYPLRIVEGDICVEVA